MYLLITVFCEGAWQLDASVLEESATSSFCLEQQIYLKHWDPFTKLYCVTSNLHTPQIPIIQWLKLI